MPEDISEKFGLNYLVKEKVNTNININIKNHQYYVTVDDFGLLFRKCDDILSPHTYRLPELNELGLIFVGSLNLRHQKTDNPVVIAIFESIE